MKPTREQVIQWAHEAVFDIVEPDEYHDQHEIADSGNIWITDRLERFAAAAREDLEKQLAAAQAENVKLRELLENHSGNYKLSKRECAVINEALSQPTDTSALESVIKKAGEVMRESLIEQCIAMGAMTRDGAFVDELRDIPGVTLEELK